MRTNIYVDGFNLYYGALKRTPHRWLNLLEMCRRSLEKKHVIQRIRYFTAHVNPRPGKPDQHVRQQTYIRALKTLPNLTVHLGFYLQKEQMMPEAPLPGGPRLLRVVRTEEKGSDVNLASYLLLDAFRKDFDAAVVISNDSDLETPIRLVRTELGIDVVGVLNPHPNTCVALKRVAKFQKSIDPTVLAASQFPPNIQDAEGRLIKRPARW